MAPDGEAPGRAVADAGSPRASLDRGDEAYAQGDFPAAFAAYREAVGAARSRGDSLALAEALTSQGLAAMRSGDPAEARLRGEEALGLKQRLGPETDHFRSYNALGLLAWDQSRLFDAIELFGRAHEIAVETDHHENLAKVQTNLGLVYVLLGDFRRAEAGFRAGLDGARAIGHLLIEGRALENLAMLAVEVGNPAAAIPLLEEGREVSRRAEDPAGEAYAIGQLGAAYAAIGDPGRAAALLDTALAIVRSQGFRQEEASNLELLATIELEAGRPRQALALFDEARQINAELGLAMETGAVLRSEAQIYSELGDHQRALLRAGEALAIHREIEVGMDELSDLLLLAELHHDVGDPAQTEAHLASASDLARTLDVRTARAGLAMTRVRIAADADRPRDVIEILSEASDDLAAGGYGIAWEAHALAGDAWARLGELDSAVVAGRRAIAAVERVQARHGAAAVGASYVARRQAVYARLVDVLLRQGDMAGAFEVSDRVRGRPLREQLRLVAGGGPAEDAVGSLVRGAELLDHIDTLTVRLEEIEALPESERRQLGSFADRLSAELVSARSEYEETLIRAERHDPGSLELLGVRAVTAEEVRSALRPGEVLVELLVDEDRLVVLALRSDGIEAVTSEIGADALASRIRIARDLLARGEPDTPGLDAVLAGLYEELLAPLARTGAIDGADRLLIVPHGELEYLAFAALRVGEGGAYLAEAHSVIHLPSAASLVALRARAQGDGEIRDGAVLTGLAPFPDELPASASEIEALGRVERGARLLRGDDATESAMREALASGGIVHAATHGVLNVWNPMFSRIELARGSTRNGVGSMADGRLEVHEIATLDVRSPLVFLSGCETALGAAGSTRFVRGEDYATLAQAFLYAGAENVIATLWRVADEGAATFAERFLEALTGQGASTPGGADYARALATAQRAMLADERYGAPYYWAGYVLSGSGGISPPPAARPIGTESRP